MEQHDRLDITEIRNSLRADLPDFQFQYLEEIDSTNRFARVALVSGTASHGSVILTDYQTAGRGRRHRRWEAPPRSSILATTVLRNPPGVLPAQIVMAAVLAVTDAIMAVADLAAEAKWPNDVLLTGRKTAGILAEHVVDRRQSYVLLGTGINVNFNPGAETDWGPEATSLQNELGRPVAREDLLIALVKALELWYRCLKLRPDEVVRAWSSLLVTLGKPVLVVQDLEEWHGFATGVDNDGALILDDERGQVRKVYAADVSIRGSSNPV